MNTFRRSRWSWCIGEEGVCVCCVCVLRVCVLHVSVCMHVYVCHVCMCVRTYVCESVCVCGSVMLELV